MRAVGVGAAANNAALGGVGADGRHGAGGGAAVAGVGLKAQNGSMMMVEGKEEGI